MTGILELRGVSQAYRLGRRSPFVTASYLQVLSNVDFAVRTGQAVGLVGESGAGKTTMTRILPGLERPQTGQVLFDGKDLWEMNAVERLEFRRNLGVVMQNPRSSLDPRMPVGSSLLEPLRSLGIDCDHVARVNEVIEQVGMASSVLGRYPHEFSGGQLQRIAIARALMTRPIVLIADEPVSALDVSIQAQVLNLLMDLVTDLNLALMLVAHDLSVVAYATSRVSVLAAGEIVETGQPLELFSRPKSKATQDLVAAVLTMEAGLAGRGLD